MIERPKSVTAICWFFIVIGAIRLLLPILRLPVDPEAIHRLAEFRRNHALNYAMMMYIGPLIALVAGVFMLGGYKWARWLIPAWFGQNVLTNALTNPSNMLLPAAFFGVALYFLYRPVSAAFFDERSRRTARLRAELAAKRKTSSAG